jgi:hypothetical protein
MAKKLPKRVRVRETQLLRGIKQGVGAVNRAAFPRVKSVRRKPKTIRNGVTSMPAMRHALNALHPCHLALPRSVGSYSVIRTTDNINANKTLMVFGCLKSPRTGYSETAWTNVIAVGSEAAASPINGTNNTLLCTSSGLDSSAINLSRMVPSAITVQIMNPEALQTTNGIVYIGRSKTVLDLNNDTRSWSTLANQLMQYSSPRLCSAGKLALRGVQVNAIPNNMSVLSDFVPRGVVEGSSGGFKTVTWDNSDFGGDFEGFAPIFVYNAGNIGLQFLVTIEWRMRFDPLNPAYAGHTFHPPATESMWHKVVSTAQSMAHGVEDIADVVADVGVVAAGVAAMAL